MNIPDEFQATATREIDVCQDEVRFEPLDGFERLRGGAGLGAYLKVRFAVYLLNQALSHDRMVVHDKDSFAAWICSFWFRNSHCQQG